MIVIQGPVRVTLGWDGPTGVAELVLDPGVYWAGARPLTLLGRGPFRFAGLGQRSAYFLSIDEEKLRAFVAASPALSRSEEVRVHLGATDFPRAEFIWMALNPGVDVPLEALTEILAASVGSQFKEPSAIVKIFDDRSELHVWDFETESFSATVLPDPDMTPLDILEEFATWVEPPPLHHLFFVRPSDPLHPPPALAGQRFHRVVYVTDTQPGEVPHHLESVLWQGLCPEDHAARGKTYFSSFVPSILVPPRTRSLATSLLSAVGTVVSWPWTGFRSLPIDDGTPDDTPDATSEDMTDGTSEETRDGTSDDTTEETTDGTGEATRGRTRDGSMPPRGPTGLQKDQCRIGFDIAALRESWRRWQNRSVRASSFPAHVFGDSNTGGSTACNATADRWARAVTNRRVGFALSGGGVHAYRVIPLIEMLHERGIPIDLFAGISGGAVIGAYYCKDGIDGLKLARARGWQFFLASSASSLWSGFMERQVDFDLGGARVEELEVMFLAVTTALSDPPAGSVVVAGTLGEAVRVSGSALVAYGPTDKGPHRYLDGSTATMVPAKVLTDQGADLVIACNCVPGPKYGNPYGGWLLGRLAHMLPIVGRLIDFNVGLTYLLTTASRVSASDAHVYWEPLPTENPLAQASLSCSATTSWTSRAGWTATE